MNVRKRRWGCAHKSGDPFWHLEMLSQRRVAIKRRTKAWKWGGEVERNPKGQKGGTFQMPWSCH